MKRFCCFNNILRFNDESRPNCFGLLLLYTFFFLFTFSGYAFSYNDPGNFRFSNVSMDNGLSNNTVNAIYKDSAGFIWLGTQNGLNRFDGIDIDVYPDFNNETIFTIGETDSVYLWIGTNFGLKVLDRRSGLVEKVELEETKVTTVRYLKYHDHVLYICSDSGLFVRKDNQISKIPLKEADHLTGIEIDPDGNFWLTNYDGLIFFNSQTKESRKYTYSENNPALNKFYCLTAIGPLIYIGSENAGVLVFNSRTGVFEPFASLGNDCILNLYFHDNRLYIGTNGGGLKVVSLRDKWVRTVAYNPNDPYSISSNAVYSFLLDHDTYWIGTFFAGLNYNIVPEKTFEVYFWNDQMNTMDMNVRSFWIGNDGCKIIGSRDGFFYISERESVFRKFSSENTILKSNIILNVYPWRGQFLIGTYSGGLYVFDPKTLKISEFKENQLFRNNSFYSFASDQKGNIWFATLSGVICFDLETEEIKQYTSSNSSLTDNSVFSILCDTKNRIWIGTAEGLCLFDYESGTIRTDIFPKEFNSGLKMIRHIYEDRDGDIWICSEKDGLVQMDANLSACRYYTDKNLLPDIFAISTIEDASGYIWIATPKGLIRYNKQTEDYSIFSIMDGIPAQMFNHVVQKDNQGRIWWANEKGLIYTSVSGKNGKLADNRHPIIITAVYIGGKRVIPGHESMNYTPEFSSVIELNADQDNVSIRFSGLDFGYPKSEIYEYKLEGSDLEWNKLIGYNQISYTDLKPGIYTLHIRKAGSFEPEKTITIVKKRSYAIYLWSGVFILVILIGIYFYRVQTIKLSSLKNMIVDSAKKRVDKSEKYQKSKLEEDESLSIHQVLLQYMDNDRPFLNSKLKLADVSAAIKCPQTKISQVLNQHLDTNFTDFVNRYRVDEFKRRAQEGVLHQYTLTALSEECGFSSRSSFFHVFKKITGQTPLEFLKDSGIKDHDSKDWKD